MKNYIKYNIKHFEIKERSDWYRYFFNFLSRQLFSSNNFSGYYSKNDFLSKWVEFWLSERSVNNIYIQGSKENPFLLKIKKKWKSFIELKTNKCNKNDFNLFVFVHNDVIKKIKDLETFRSFCYMVISWKPCMIGKWIKKWIIETKLRSRTLTTIWKSFWDTTKDVMSKRIKRSKTLFNEFQVSSRYTTYHDKIVRLSNLYNVNEIIYKYIPIWKKIKKDTDKNMKTIIPKANNKKVIFWNKIEIKKWEKMKYFTSNDYSDFYKNIVDNIFS